MEFPGSPEKRWNIANWVITVYIPYHLLGEPETTID